MATEFPDGLLTGYPFRRLVELYFEKRDDEGNTVSTRTVNNLNVEFEVVRTLEMEPSTLKATLYNLSEDTRKELEEHENTLVTLRVGYFNKLHDIFTGDLRIVRHRREGGDLGTYIESGDGERGAKLWARKGFPKNTTLLTVAKYLIQKAGFKAPKNLQSLTVDEYGNQVIFKAGIAVCGYALDELRELCISNGIEVSVQSNAVVVERISTLGNDYQYTEVRPGTGLIGSPTLDSDGILEFETIMLAGIFPGSTVYVESEFIEGGFFRVLRATYSGSVYGDNFGMLLEAKQRGT